MNDSELTLSNQPCEACGSSDAKAYYSDGHGYCFSCKDYTPGTEDSPSGEATSRHSNNNSDAYPNADTEHRPINKRGLSLEDCRLWDYRLSVDADPAFQLAIYKTEHGEVVGSKMRFADKTFKTRGRMKAKDKPPLFGMHLWPRGGRKLIITEGEIDAISMSKMQGHKYPVVSIPNGVDSAARSISDHLDWVQSFEEVVLFFDHDKHGRRAAGEVSRLFPSGKVKVTKGDLKDANEYLVEGRIADAINCVFRAEVFRPDGIVTVAQVKDAALRERAITLPWWTPQLTELTYGRRFGECVALGAGTGVGKTDFILQQVLYDVETLNEKVGLYFLEQQPDETVVRLAGKLDRKRYHLPPAAGGYTPEARAAAIERLAGKESIYLYDAFGHAQWDTIADLIRFNTRAHGVRIHYLDHLTALADDGGAEEMDVIMKGIGSIVKELDVWLLFVSHLATPQDGPPHEEGGRVKVRHFRGSRAIGFWAHDMLGLERDQQADDEEERLTTTLRILKQRYAGSSVGQTTHYLYDVPTGTLNEYAEAKFNALPPEKSKPDGNGDF